MARIFSLQVRLSRFLLGIFLLTFFGSDSQMAPAASGRNFKVLENGAGHTYEYISTVTLDEPGGGDGKDVGYQILGEVSVAVIWQSPKDELNKLLEFELLKPKLLIKSRKAPTPDGFVIHSSKLENLRNSPFLAHWEKGRVSSIYTDTKEDKSIVNVKKGISSLFQFQLMNKETTETDASGECIVSYRTIDSHSFEKTKTDCSIPRRGSVDLFRSAAINSSRTTTYVLSKDQTFIESISTSERHELRLAVKRDVGGTISATQKLTFSDTKGQVNALTSIGLKEALEEFEKLKGISLQGERLGPGVHLSVSEPESLPKMIKENREQLSNSKLGTLRSANAFHKVLSSARAASQEELSKSFKGTKNKEILPQLCDLAGAIHTPESHDTIMKLFNFDNDEDLDNLERYFWSLSVAAEPNEHILRDIYMRSQRGIKNEKLSHTITLTLGAMARKYRSVSSGNDTLSADIAKSLLKDLSSCRDDDCTYKYLIALKNLKCPNTISVLIEHALRGKKKASVGAMKALRSLDPLHWSEKVIDTAQRIYFQAGKKYDSSARTLAVDILLESKPSRDVLRELLISLTRPDRSYEVKQYLVQRLNQLSEKCSSFAKEVQAILLENTRLYNNYNVKAQRGLTTAFTRSITSSSHRNISLVSVQELFGGFLKRGLVDIVMETPEKSNSLFTLGLFAGGLSSFVSSGDKQEENDGEEDEAATAGMELKILDVQLRPFVFFTGQGELMGHVWSGSASEKTPAYQALIVTHDQSSYVPLQNGLVSHLQLLGVISFDLSGQVQFSFWNKNAHSLVEKSAGIFLQGILSVDTSFVRSKMDFNLATEVKLNLESHLNFYSEIALCMQLSQPECVIKHNIHKMERIPGSKHRLRRSKYKQTKVPGRTYALNRKNNEMCSLIFKNQ